LLKRKPVSLLVMVPAPKFSLPGCAFALAIRSPTDLTSLAALTTSSSIVFAVSVIGTKSLNGS
jgi:hypothetical protein